MARTRISIIALFTFFLIALPVQAASPDLSIRSADISFSKSTLVSGDTVRIYAAVQNIGEIDISGYVLFYHGSTPIGASQTVTVPAGGSKDQVWVDFTVPYGSFNIRAEIRGSDPQDINASNDIAITSLFYPMLDEDKDGIADDEDNCPEVSNSDQADYDNDAKGDACDTDDDNDGLSDSVEAELGTFPKNSDSDGDGVLDAKDYAPLNSSIQTEPESIATSTYNQDVIDVSSDDPAPDSSVSSDELPLRDEEPVPTLYDENADLDASDNSGAEPMLIMEATSTFVADFIFERDDWKTYSFKPLMPELNGITYKWDFGDSIVSSQSEVSHTYRSAGKYKVSLTMENADGAQTSQEQEVKISLFHLANPLIWLALGILTLLFFGSILLVFKRRKQKAGNIKKMSFDDSGSNSAFDSLEEVEDTEDMPEDEDATEEIEEIEDEELVEEAPEEIEEEVEEEEIPEEMQVEEVDESDEEVEEEENEAIEDDLDEEENEVEEEVAEEEEDEDIEDVVQASELDEPEEEEVEEMVIAKPKAKKKAAKKTTKKRATKKPAKKAKKK